MQDKYQEITIAVIGGSILFIIFSGVILYFLFLNQKKKFTHAHDIQKMKELFNSELLSAKLEIQEHTFHHISEEIHDNVGQILSLAKVQINIMNESDHLTKGMLNEVKEHISKALTDLRDIAKSLNTERLKNVGIVEAAMIESDRVNKTGFINSVVFVEGEECKLDEQKKQIVFRIIQESLQNILKHSEATEIKMQFKFTAATLFVSIKDNGKGFDVEKAVSNGSGLGLQNIKTRSNLIGAILSIESILNEGTTINIELKYE
jgi:hypothetical protein